MEGTGDIDAAIAEAEDQVAAEGAMMCEVFRGSSSSNLASREGEKTEATTSADQKWLGLRLLLLLLH